MTLEKKAKLVGYTPGGKRCPRNHLLIEGAPRNVTVGGGVFKYNVFVCPYRHEAEGVPVYSEVVDHG